MPPRWHKRGIVACIHSSWADALYNLCFPVQTAPGAVCRNGVMAYVLHPVEPQAIRLTLAGAF